MDVTRFSDRSFDDALATSSGGADYQRKMAKAMRIRSERHDQALAAMRDEHQNQIKKLQQESTESLQNQVIKFNVELEKRNMESTTVLENALASAQRQANIDKQRAIEVAKAEMEEEYNSKLVSALTQHQDSSQGLVEHHKEELRKRLSQMAQQKDELHLGDKILALKENDKKWEIKLRQRLEECKEELQKEHDLELESVKQECEKTVQDLTVQYTIERNRLGAEMLDQREETRRTATQSEQSKLELKLKEMKLDLEAAHKEQANELKNNFEKQMVKERSQWEESKKQALAKQEGDFTQQINELQDQINQLHVDHEQKSINQLAISGRITEQLESERDQLLQQGVGGGSGGSLIPSAKTLVASTGIALLALMALFAMCMIFEYRHWLFYAHSLDRRFT